MKPRKCKCGHVVDPVEYESYWKNKKVHKFVYNCRHCKTAFETEYMYSDGTSIHDESEKNMNKGKLEQLEQLTRTTWDGDLISKRYRDELVECEYVFQSHGFNCVTFKGIEVLVNLGVLKQGESA